MSLWHPDRYHGWGRQKSYFEGWYYKLVSKDESLAMALIPGISMDAAGHSHSFIQMIDGTAGKTYYETFSNDQFKTLADKFEVSIGRNHFNDAGLTINLPQIQGEISFLNVTPWPSQLGAPGIMGWYSFVPLMQCYHGVVSMHHSLKGKLEYNDRMYDFDDGLGYIEKDWGTSFPKCWIWMQSNHFDDLNRKVSIMASVAHIPWMGNYFIGHLVTMVIDETLYKFTTYNGSKYSARHDDDKVYITFERKGLRLEIEAIKGHTGSLISPLQGEMTGKVNESLTSILNISFYKNGKEFYKGKGRHAGLEVAGDVNILLTSK